MNRKMLGSGKVEVEAMKAGAISHKFDTVPVGWGVKCEREHWEGIEGDE